MNNGVRHPGNLALLGVGSVAFDSRVRAEVGQGRTRVTGWIRRGRDTVGSKYWPLALSEREGRDVCGRVTDRVIWPIEARPVGQLVDLVQEWRTKG